MRLIIAEKPELGRAIADALFTHPETHDSVISEVIPQLSGALDICCH